MRTFFLLFLFYVSNNVIVLAADTTGYTLIPLKQAIEENKVKTYITGSYNPKQYYRYSDGNGVHYGRCMDVIIESHLDTFVVLKLDAGYSLIPEDSTFQTMYVTKSMEFPLYPNSTIPFSVYAMCGEIHDQPPFYGVKYSLGALADSLVLKTIEVVEREYLQNIVGQHMVWAVANSANKAELVKYGADSISLDKTISTLQANYINCSLVNELGVGKVDSKPAYMRVKRVTVYSGIAYMLVITSGMIFLAVRRYTRKESVRQS